MKLLLVVVLTLTAWGALGLDSGLITRNSAFNVPTTVDRIEKIIEDRYPPINVALAFDHQANAHRVGLELPPTTVVFFGNPSLGTLFMQVDQRIGIDLPLHVLVWEEGPNEIQAAYNAPFSYLKARYGIESRDPQFTTMNNTLAAIVEYAVGEEKKLLDIVVANNATKRRAPGLIAKKSAHNVKLTLDRLEAAFEGGPIGKVLRVDHQAAAQGVGLDLRPTEVLMFGNPLLGTPLMNDNRRIGNDLPQKVLAWQDASGDVWLEYNDIYYFKERYAMEGNEQIFETIANALNTLTDNAVAP